MEDIIVSEPWHCGDSDCPVGWHLANYWLYDDGTHSVDKYSDGDHEDCGEGDIPQIGQVEAAWADYYDHVEATGEDPLNEFSGKVATSWKRWAKWVLTYWTSDQGAVLVDVAKGRLHWSGTLIWETPEHVVEYADVTKTSGITGVSGSPTGNEALLWNGVLDEETSEVDRSLATLHVMAEENDLLVFRGRSTRNPAIYVHCEIAETIPRKESAIKRDTIAAAKAARRKSMERIKGSSQ